MLCEAHVTHANLSGVPALDSVQTLDPLQVAKCKYAITVHKNQSSLQSHLGTL